MGLYNLDLKTVLQEFTRETLATLEKELSPEQYVLVETRLQQLEADKVFELYERELYGVDS